jgi:hypothetical protein
VTILLYYFKEANADLLYVIRSGPSTQEEEEAPVQGPLPYEPDDAPWKRNESGIRKL